LEENLLNIVSEVVNSETKYTTNSYKSLRLSLFAVECGCVRTEEYQLHMEEQTRNNTFNAFSGDKYLHVCKKCQLLEALDHKIQQGEQGNV